MAILKLAAGLAVGYVLGSAAGREKYEQIAQTARKVSAHPTVVQAQEQAKSLISAGVQKANPDSGTSSSSSTPELETTTVLDTTSEAPGPVTNKRKRVTTPATPVTPATTTLTNDPLV